MSSSGTNLPAGWILTRLGDLYTFEYGKSLTKGARATDGIYPVYGSSGIVGMHDQYLIEGPAIIIGRKGAAGSVNYSADNLWPIDTTYYVRDDKNLYLKFSCYLFRSLNLAKLEASTAIPGLNRNHAYDETVLLPPLKEQHRIVAKIEELFSELDKGIENLKTAQAQLKVYRQALLKHAFEGKLTVQWREQRRAKQSVAPAKAGAQPLNGMDSHPTPSRGQAVRGNDEVGGGNDEPLETAADLLKRIQQERAQRYEQQLAEWEKSPSIPLLQRGKPTSTAPIPPLEKGGRGGISKPKPPKTLPPLTTEELAELPELPEGWGWCKWEDILVSEKGAFKRGPFGSALKKEFFVKSGYKVYEQYCPINDDCSFERYYISDEKFKELESFSVRADDFLVSCSGVTLGRITQIPLNFKEGIINQALLRVRVNKAVYDFKFFKTFFRSRYFQKRILENSTGTAIPNVKGVNELKAIPLPLCSLLEQQQIVFELDARLSEADQLDQTITTSLQQAEALRQSILKKAFSGQLVPQDPNDEPASELLARIKAERLTSQGNGVVRRKGGGRS
ncbi:MAG: restriction endonuclease subunit S [Nitrosomonas ureae]